MDRTVERSGLFLNVPRLVPRPPLPDSTLLGVEVGVWMSTPAVGYPHREEREFYGRGPGGPQCYGLHGGGLGVRTSWDNRTGPREFLPSGRV